MGYLSLAKSVRTPSKSSIEDVSEAKSLTTLTTLTTKGLNPLVASDPKSKATGRDPLPPMGDPRREPMSVIDDVWEAGCRVVLEGGTATVQPRARLTPELAERFELHRDVVIALLTRMPGGQS